MPGRTAASRASADATEAAIEDDTTSDIVEWTIKYDITGVNFKTNKLVVYHYNDAERAQPGRRDLR